MVVFTAEIAMRLFIAPISSRYSFSRWTYLSSFFGFIDVASIAPWSVPALHFELLLWLLLLFFFFFFLMLLFLFLFVLLLLVVVVDSQGCVFVSLYFYGNDSAFVLALYFLPKSV